MKKLVFTLIGFLLMGTQGSGQENVTVKAGENVDESFSLSRYLFPEFRNARVFLKNESLDAKMNYNVLSGQMEFINGSGEILALDGFIHAIVFGDRVFKQTPKGYLEIIVDNLGTELLIHRKYNAGDIKKHGAYGTVSSSASIDTYSSVSVGSGEISLTPGQDVTYTKTNTYYIFSGGKYRLANKSGFTKVFGKQKPGLGAYLKNRPVNFLKEEELIRLFNFCTE